VIADIWVDGELRLTFRRNFDDHLFQIWQELLAVVENVELKDETDSLVWCYSQSGVYSVQTFYAIINFRGVKPMFVHAVWSIATVDNLNKRGTRKSTQCRFCEEDEGINHLFFECVVSKNIWGYACEFFGFDIGRDYISIAGKWLNKEKHYVTNMISAAMLRGIWLVRNDFVFHQQVWSDVKMVLRKILGLSWEWRILCKEGHMEMMTRWLSFLELQIQEPLKITND
jgi:hypothetical protein